MKGMEILRGLVGRRGRGGRGPDRYGRGGGAAGATDAIGDVAKAIAADERQHVNRRARARLGYVNRADERHAFHKHKGAGAAARLSSRAGSTWHHRPSFVRQVKRQRAAAIEAARADRAVVTSRKRPRAGRPQT